MRHSTVALVLVVVALSGADAEGAAPQRTARRTKPAAAASASTGPAGIAEALPPLPPPSPESIANGTLTLTSATVPAPPPLPPAPVEVAAERPSPATEAPKASQTSKPSGAVLQLGMGGLVPAGSFVKGVPLLGAGVSFELRVGSYLTQHFGLLIGVRGSYGHVLSGCVEGSCSGYSLQVPLLVQFAAKDRHRGVYGELGVGLATTYGGTVPGGSYTLTSPVEAKFGVGVRAPASPTTSFDFNFGMDVGQITSVEATSGGTTSTPSAEGLTHVVIALNLIFHFSL